MGKVLSFLMSKHVVRVLTTVISMILIMWIGLSFLKDMFSDGFCHPNVRQNNLFVTSILTSIRDWWYKVFFEWFKPSAFTVLMLTTGHQWTAFVKLSNIYVSLKRKRGCSLFVIILLTLHLPSQMQKNYQYNCQSLFVVVVLWISHTNWCSRNNSELCEA
jgi:hypothetical protein